MELGLLVGELRLLMLEIVVAADADPPGGMAVRTAASELTTQFCVAGLRADLTSVERSNGSEVALTAIALIRGNAETFSDPYWDGFLATLTEIHASLR